MNKQLQSISNVKLKTAAAVLLALCAATSAARAEDNSPPLPQPSPVLHGSLQDGDRIAILGDSITEQKNYSVIIEDYLLACQPAAQLQAVQFGWGGETTWGLSPRLGHDVLWYQPTVATINYGMNDGGYRGVDDKRLDDYRTNTKSIIDQLRNAGCRLIVVGGPGAVDPDVFRTFVAAGRKDGERYNQTLAKFNDAARDVAQQEGVAFADLHTTMANAMAKFKELHPGQSFVGTDGIHPENVGHTVMAYAFLKAMGCNGDIGTITVDLSANTAQATAGHTVLSCANGTTTIQSARWPFVIVRNSDIHSIAAAMDLVPFLQDLDRYTLIVNNAPAGKQLKVTWTEQDPPTAGPGEQAIKPIVVSADFSADQLAHGINLAAVFPTNPFQHAFDRLDAAIHAQQDFETPLIKQWLHNQQPLSQAIPNTAAALTNLVQSGENFDQQLRNVASAMVVPVKHSLKIEVEP